MRQGRWLVRHGWLLLSRAFTHLAQRHAMNYRACIQGSPANQGANAKISIPTIKKEEAEAKSCPAEWLFRQFDETGGGI